MWHARLAEAADSCASLPGCLVLVLGFWFVLVAPYLLVEAPRDAAVSWEHCLPQLDDKWVHS